jgi:hypothetical protein
VARSFEEALTALDGPGRPIAHVELPDEPGLYALHADEETWIELRLGPPPDHRPLYVGKAQESLAKRVGREHFRTGRRLSRQFVELSRRCFEVRSGCIPFSRAPRELLVTDLSLTTTSA